MFENEFFENSIKGHENGIPTKNVWRSSPYVRRCDMNEKEKMIAAYSDTMKRWTLDRQAISQAVAKVIAYQQCGKPEDAYKWFEILKKLLGY